MKSDPPVRVTSLAPASYATVIPRAALATVGTPAPTLSALRTTKGSTVERAKGEEFR
jgi:hypothetical protein